MISYTPAYPFSKETLIMLRLGEDFLVSKTLTPWLKSEICVFLFKSESK